MKNANLSVNNTMQRTPDGGFFQAPDVFNLLRAIAILCVFGLHCVIVSKAARPDAVMPAFLYTPAWLSMWVLFALSGYLLAPKFYQHQYEGIQGSWRFICRRFWRLAPPYFIFLWFAFLFINPSFFISSDWPLTLRLLSFTYNGIPGIDGVGATWFVSTIMQLYIMLPLFYHLVFKKIPERYTLWIVGVIILLGFAFRLSIRKPDWYIWIYTFSVANLDIFLAPFLLGGWLSRHTQDTPWRRLSRYLSPVLLGILIVSCGYCVYSGRHFLFYQRVCPTLAVLLVCLICFGFSVPGKNKLQLGFFKSPLYLLDCFGSMSFSFYLYHSNMLCIIAGIIPHLSNTAYVWLTAGGGFIVSLIMGILMYFLVERNTALHPKRG